MAALIEQFVLWEEGIKPEITHISGILAKRLSDEPEELIADLEDAEVWNSRAQNLLAQANSWVDRATWELMPAKEGRMESDRKAQLESDVAPIRLIRDTLEGFVDAIKQRLILGAGILAYMRQFAERKANPTIQKPQSKGYQSHEDPF
jgi:hypothetical protein